MHVHITVRNTCQSGYKQRSSSQLKGFPVVPITPYLRMLSEVKIFKRKFKMTHICSYVVHVHTLTSMEVRGQLAEDNSLLPPHLRIKLRWSRWAGSPITH